ncbi:hypothetical protein [Candidatus Poriferisodalis sp.]|uniref:hypothetical protein n=1 Tax=Candidatus Poriferisodalis sp. TaxID=3101277 RepID=UPI003B01E6D0
MSMGSAPAPDALCAGDQHHVGLARCDALAGIVHHRLRRVPAVGGQSGLGVRASGCWVVAAL